MAENGDQSTRLLDIIIVAKGRKIGIAGGLVLLQMER